MLRFPGLRFGSPAFLFHIVVFTTKSYRVLVPADSLASGARVQAFLQRPQSMFSEMLSGTEQAESFDYRLLGLAGLPCFTEHRDRDLEDLEKGLQASVKQNL